MKTIEQTTDEVLNLAATHFKISRAELQPGDDFYKKLGIDSLQALELLTRLENHFGRRTSRLRGPGRQRFPNARHPHSGPAVNLNAE